jgi:16S rRNA (guanine527-N7)-methyltransferase
MLVAARGGLRGGRAAAAAAECRRRVLDVGSGGGLPGVVLAILSPAVDVTCVDAVGKKAAFVRQARASSACRISDTATARVETHRDSTVRLDHSRAVRERSPTSSG